MVHSTTTTTTLFACVVSATLTGTALGLLVGASSVYMCCQSSSSREIARRFAGLLCRKTKPKNFPKRLILVRHGESEGNIDPSLYGHVPDNAMHLTALGYEQAVAAGHSIRKIVGHETMRFIVSPYVRTIETFGGILKALDFQGQFVPWTEEPRIREQDFGNFQEPVKIRECKAQRRRFGSFFYRFPSGESPADVYDRVSSFLESLYRMFEKSSEENYVLVTHGVAIRVILTRYFKYRISEFELLENFHNGECVVLEFDERQGKLVLKTIVSNDVHLFPDGSVAVQTSETTQLRTRSSDTLSNLSGLSSTSPTGHERYPPPPMASTLSFLQHSMSPPLSITSKCVDASSLAKSRLTTTEVPPQ